MSQRTVKAVDVKTLQDWVKRWPNAGNLEFDTETREPTIYNEVKRGDPSRKKVATIPWKREADIITVLTQSSRFSDAAVSAARKRISTMNETQRQLQHAGEEQMRIQEAALLAAYREPPSAVRIQNILAAEKSLTAMEIALAKKGRVIISLGQYQASYVPPIPNAQRALTEVGKV